jgi:DNA repair protein RadC
MQTLMVKSGETYRVATPAEVAEVAGHHAREDLNRARPMLNLPSNVVAHLQRIYTGRDYETFTVLFLDTRYQLLEAVELFRGTINASSVYPREVVKECLWRGAVSVILAHNHPSGFAKPSAADEAVTEALQQALALIDVRVLDHLIIARGRHYSFAEHGLM